MPRKTTGKNKNGLPLTIIDWKKVDELLEADCPGIEIAAAFGISPDTLYRRCEDEKGVTFTAYKQEKKAKGDSKLRSKQFFVACEKDNIPMLIWLGKQRLGQKEPEKISDSQGQIIHLHYPEKHQGVNDASKNTSNSHNNKTEQAKTSENNPKRTTKKVSKA